MSWSIKLPWNALKCQIHNWICKINNNNNNSDNNNKIHMDSWWFITGKGGRFKKQNRNKYITFAWVFASPPFLLFHSLSGVIKQINCRCSCHFPLSFSRSYGLIYIIFINFNLSIIFRKFITNVPVLLLLYATKYYNRIKQIKYQMTRENTIMYQCTMYM